MKALVALGMALPLAGACQGYFQQQVDYTISVRLDDERHELHAHERFRYRNNSTLALDTIWMHLWPNAYKERGTALVQPTESLGRSGPALREATRSAASSTASTSMWMARRRNGATTPSTSTSAG
ncbi:MAG: hypothetical protein IPJ85_02955 [Flavobacteriales bacterium]|nr:hypothetical protein [Flavobacteriales bacterium]